MRSIFTEKLPENGCDQKITIESITPLPSTRTDYLGGTGFVGALMQKHEASDEMFAEMNEGFENAGRVVGGAVVGALVGVMVGSLIGSEQWEKVYGDYSIGMLERSPTGQYQVVFGYSF